MDPNNASSNNTNEEDYGNSWIVCGKGGEVFVGKLAGFSSDTDHISLSERIVSGRSIRMDPCYKQSTHTIPVPQVHPMTGKQIGINLVQQESATSLSGLPCDVGVTMQAPDWVIVPSETPDPERSRVVGHIQRIVKAAREIQMRMRGAAAGLQT